MTAPERDALIANALIALRQLWDDMHEEGWQARHVDRLAEGIAALQQAAAAIASLRDDLAELRAATFPPPLGPHLERMQDRAEKAEAELAAAQRRIAVLEESHAVGAMELDAAQRSPPREGEDGKG